MRKMCKMRMEFKPKKYIFKNGLQWTDNRVLEVKYLKATPFSSTQALGNMA